MSENYTILDILKETINEFLNNKIQKSLQTIYTGSKEISTYKNNYSKYQCVNKLLEKVK